MLRQWGGSFFLGLKSNRQLNPDGQGNSAIRDVGFPPTALPTQLKGFGWVISDRVEAGEEEVRFFIINKELNLDEAQVQQKRKDAQNIEGIIEDSNQSARLSVVRLARPATTNQFI